jgi:flagellar biosynthesis anti-sigma factor FlgM
MKIDDVYRDLGVLGGGAEALQRKKTAGQEEPLSAADPVAGEGANVSISSTSLEFSKAAEMVDREPPGRAERIQEIQRQVQEGTYEVDPVAVAEKILKETLAG